MKGIGKGGISCGGDGDIVGGRPSRCGWKWEINRGTCGAPAVFLPGWCHTRGVGVRFFLVLPNECAAGDFARWLFGRGCRLVPGRIWIVAGEEIVVSGRPGYLRNLACSASL